MIQRLTINVTETLMKMRNNTKLRGGDVAADIPTQSSRQENGVASSPEQINSKHQVDH